jgi:hypothetical protein
VRSEEAIRRLRERAGFAQRRAPFRAGQAMAAAGHEDHGDVIAGNQVVDTVADLNDDACRFVFDRHWQWSRAAAVDDR